MSNADKYVKGAKVYMAESVRKSGVVITEGIITTKFDFNDPHAQLMYVKHPSLHNLEAIYEWRAMVKLTEIEKCPWKLTPEAATQFLIDFKYAQVKKYEKAIRTVNAQIDVLQVSLREFQRSTKEAADSIRRMTKTLESLE